MICFSMAENSPRAPKGASADGCFSFALRGVETEKNIRDRNRNHLGMSGERWMQKKLVSHTTHAEGKMDDADIILLFNHELPIPIKPS